MSMHGEVHTWYMTPEELAEYVKKHPIVPTEKPSGSSYTDVHEMQRKKTIENRANGKNPIDTIMDKVDQDKLHKLYMAGHTQRYIAKALNLNVSTLSNYLTKQRKLHPDKWPSRKAKK